MFEMITLIILCTAPTSWWVESTIGPALHWCWCGARPMSITLVAKVGEWCQSPSVHFLSLSLAPFLVVRICSWEIRTPSKVPPYIAIFYDFFFFALFLPLDLKLKSHILFLSNLFKKLYRFELQHQTVKRQLPKHFQ
ncbi:hypothetical protein BDV41DRAFT_375683 [Aspergillus transmontanensis]|uniref:Uncharacterized protein n=1 Tax=Aspergillus transmontanensis TaxID=1034304 RepID=A0A5N6WG29_9EURO|nr:hypothetical protein BDV41DRAFT_375683 [Aspergillus transmontanensis]